MYKPKYHHKTNVWIAFAFLAALSTGGCAQGDEPNTGNTPSGEGNSVIFGAYISNATESRAAVADIATLKRTGFGVFASRTGNDDFDPDAAEGFTPDFMYNQKVEWRVPSSGSASDATWSYEPQKGWPGSKVSFFAYAPYTYAFGKTGITGISGPDTSGSPKLTFATDGDVGSQIDLLYADADKTVDLVNQGQVQFRFKHALSRVGFKCAVDETIDGKTTVTINGVVLKSSAIGVSGDLNLCTGAWENINAAEKKYALGTDDFIAGSNVITKADGTKASDLTADGKYLMIIPSNEAVPLEIAVNYDVVTTDANLDGGSVKISNEIATTLDFNFETGKAYWLTLRLGMKSVKIGADISDWDDYETGWTPVEKP